MPRTQQAPKVAKSVSAEGPLAGELEAARAEDRRQRERREQRRPRRAAERPQQQRGEQDEPEVGADVPERPARSGPPSVAPSSPWMPGSAPA